MMLRPCRRRPGKLADGNERVAGAVGVDEEHGLGAEARQLVDPQLHVAEVEGLRPHLLGRDAGGDVLCDHLAGVACLREVDPVEADLAVDALELRRHVDPELLKQRDALLVRQEGGAGRIEVGAEGRVPPMYSATVVARGSDASILPLSDLNSASVRSLVQHLAEAGAMSLPVASYGPA